MAIITLAQYKTLMGIGDVDATRDARITALIPQIEQEIVDYCNNQFTVSGITFTGKFTPTVAAGQVYTLVCTAGGISAISFASGDTILLDGTVRNDGRYTATNFSDTVITVSEQLVGETEVSASVTLVKWPAGLQVYAARMISYQLAHIGDAGVTSETIKSYSYSRANGGSADAGYPVEILRGLDRWRSVKIGRGRRVDHYIDKRGSWVPDEVNGLTWQVK